MEMQSQDTSQHKTDAENIKDGKSRRGKKPPKKITERYLYNSGLAYLQRFPASTPHFRRIMGRKIDKSCNYHKDQERETCIALLDSAIAQFERMGLLDDNAYLSGMINSLRRRGLSTQAILSKLGQKGLSREAILATLMNHDEQTGVSNADLAAATLLTRRKKIGPYRRNNDADRNKELAALARAGFGFDIAQKALSLSQDEAEDIIAQIRL